VAMIDALREKVSKAPIIHAGERLPSLSFSAGVATAHAVNDLRTLITCADKALYAAKAAGRHQTEVFEESLSPELQVQSLSSARKRVVK